MYENKINELSEKIKILSNKKNELEKKINDLNHEYTVLHGEFINKYLNDDFRLEEHLREKKVLKRKVIKKNEDKIPSCIFSLLYTITFFLLILGANDLPIEFAFLKIISSISCALSAIATGFINVSVIKKIIYDFKGFKIEYDEKLEELQQKVNSEVRKKDKEILDAKEEEIQKNRSEYQKIYNLERTAYREIIGYHEEQIRSKFNNNIPQNNKVKKRIK